VQEDKNYQLFQKTKIKHLAFYRPQNRG